MYAVIFKAEIKQLDSDYLRTAKRMRELALTNYGCVDFISVCEGDTEISISYWKDKQNIQAWKEDPEHIAAQTRGKQRWYKSYSVQISKIEHQYASET